MPPVGFQSVDRQSTPDEKIRLFRSLFRGREDLYARRFESFRSGKTGYSLVCANEWINGVCEKPRIKCTDCRHQRFLPLTNEVIRKHLVGTDDKDREFIVGIYPMLLDETCFFLAIDFGDDDWQQDATTVLETCRQYEIPAVLERSRSGNGAHIWIFFATAVPASIARRLGSHLLTEAMERRPDIGLHSYDRLVPNQDTLPKRDPGGLIALPLQMRSRRAGNSVFIDHSFEPYADQWALLSSITRMTQATAEKLVSKASRSGRILNVQVPRDVAEDLKPGRTSSRRRRQLQPITTSSSRIELVLANQIYIAKQHLTPLLHNKLMRLAAFQNPEFHRAQSMRLPTRGIPRIISCVENEPERIALPRGCYDDIRRLLDDLGIEFVIRDHRTVGESIDLEFHGALRPNQHTAARKLLAHDTGVLSATTAFGKTVTAAWIIAQRSVNTLVLVHRRQLLDQWVDRLSKFLGTSAQQIGRHGGGVRELNGMVDVAIMQSLVRKGVVQDCVADYGQLIIDECHHLSAASFEQIARRSHARFVLGLSATVTRRDGHHPIVLMQCGPIRHHVDAKREATLCPVERNVIVRPTMFNSLSEANADPRIQLQELYRDLIADNSRNALILEDVISSVRKGHSPLVLSERREHLDLLARSLRSDVKHVVLLKGGTDTNESRAIRDRLACISPDEGRVILATGKLIGEGFDDERLDTLLLALPVSWRGTIAQYVGRLHRDRNNKKKEVRVYDYADLNVPMLSRMFDRRCESYESVGYTVLLPGSAIAGWPSEVLLPVDPRWKSDYATTVRRLARDGIDASLANLFVHVAREFEPDASGVLRARSAAEAFLYHRLESLPGTAGRFELNASLPIPFDGWGNMEVDLLDKSARIAVEIDGGQHFRDADAYRSDRRKDALLQQHDYFVLRFLVEDIGKRLDDVLDTILKTLVHRAGGLPGRSSINIAEVSRQSEIVRGHDSNKPL